MNQLIGFLEEQLTVSEPTPDYTRHNQEIITYIEYLKSMKQPQLNENQQIVLDWLKEKYTVTNIEPIELFWRLRVNSIKPYYRDRPVYRSYRYMSKTGQLQVLQAFSQWALEQEEE
ncbi:hypothetical protein SFC81_03685 [Enterococcus faecalis]